MHNQRRLNPPNTPTIPTIYDFSWRLFIQIPASWFFYISTYSLIHWKNFMGGFRVQIISVGWLCTIFPIIKKGNISDMEFNYEWTVSFSPVAVIFSSFSCSIYLIKIILWIRLVLSRICFNKKTVRFHLVAQKI